MAAYGLVMPVFILLSGIAGPIINGVNKVCGSSIGRGDLDTSNKVFTSSLVGGGILAAIVASLLMLFPMRSSMLLGANGAAAGLQVLTEDYLRGLSVGIIPFILIIIFLPFMQLNGDKKVISFALTSMSVLDIVFDLANLFIFRGGLFGMALASSLSYWAAFLIIIANFLKKKGGLFHFDIRNWDFRRFLHIISQGAPSILLKVCNLVQSIGLNYVVIHMLSVEMLAVYSVISSIQLIAYTPGVGIGEGTLLVSSMMYGEEDRHALKRVQREGVRLAVLLNGIIICIGMVFSRLIAAVYLSGNPKLVPAAAFGLRLILLSTIPYSLQMMYRNYLQAIGHQAKVMWLTFLNELPLALGAALLMTAIFAETGFWLSFIVRDILTLLTVFIFIYRYSRDKGTGAESALMLPLDFGARDQDKISCSLRTVEDVVRFFDEVRQFCL